MSTFGALIGLCCSAATLAGSQRDQAISAAGTATISGVVEIAGTSERVKAAVVTLSSARGQISLDAITDGDGRFVFEKLPSGSYGLSARRPSFVSIPFGASRPGRAGLPINLGDGQRLSDLRVRLARGSVITGTVRDESGTPVPDMEVRVQRLGASLASAQTAIARTSHRGEYRVFGLEAGSYVVSTRLSAAPKGEFEQPSTADVDAALRRIELRRSGIGAIGPPVSAASAGASPAVVKGSWVAVYHSSAFNRADAIPIELATGEERGGVDISFRPMPAASVTGHISGLGGFRSADVELALRPFWAQSPTDISRTNLAPDGTFSFTGVVPGRYTMAARVAPSRGCFHASEEILVQGGEVSGVALSLRPCGTLAGQIRGVTQTAPLPTALLGVRVELRPAGGLSMFVPARPPTTVGKDGRFILGEAGDLIAGEYTLAVTVPGAEPGRGWRIESALTEGSDIVDDGFIVPAGDVLPRSVTLVFTDQHNSLSGTLAVAANEAASQYTVVVVTANPAWWKMPFRRVFAVRPGTDGRFRVDDLPAGDYYLAAMTDLAPDDWRDPAVLKEVTASGTRISIGAAEHKVQALRIAR